MINNGREIVKVIFTRDGAIQGCLKRMIVG